MPVPKIDQDSERASTTSDFDAHSVDLTNASAPPWLQDIVADSDADDVIFDFAARPFLPKECDRNIPVPTQHPTARQLATGIVQAGRAGGIAAWRNGNRKRDIDFIEQMDGALLLPCPAHDDGNPSFVVSDVPDLSGHLKTVFHCRGACPQDKVLKVLHELGLWNCTPEMIEALNAPIGAEKSGRSKKAQAKDPGIAIIPIPLDAPEPPNEHRRLGPMANRWAYRDCAGAVVCYACRFEPNPIWQRNYEQATKEYPLEAPAGKTIRPLTYRQYQDGSKRYAFLAP